MEQVYDGGREGSGVGVKKGNCRHRVCTVVFFLSFEYFFFFER